MSKKVVLVTGASSGIGNAAALKFLEMGYVVYAAARTIKGMDNLKKKKAIVVGLDITKPADIKKLVNKIKRTHKHLDILVNNAGIGYYYPFEDSSIETAKYQFEVNFFGLATLTQLCLPLLQKNKGSRIINISSVLGRMYIPYASWYVASKHALEGFSDALRYEMKDKDIHVSVVEPAGTKTNFRSNMRILSGDSDHTDFNTTLNKGDKTQNKLVETLSSSTVENVVKAITHAATHKTPKARYTLGFIPRILITLKNLFGEKLFDTIIRKVF